MMRWPIVGMIIEMYGMVRLFGSYFPMIFSMIRQVLIIFYFKQIPGVGSVVDKIPYIKNFISSAGSQTPKYPNV